MRDHALGVDGHNDTLAPEPHGRVLDKFRIVDRGGVDRHLVATGEEQVSDIIDRPYPSADRKRHEHLFRGAADDVEDDAAFLVGRRDVEERELVRPLLVVKPGDLDRVAGVAQVHEAHAFYHPSRLHVETGYDAFRQHGDFLVSLCLSSPSDAIGDRVF